MYCKECGALISEDSYFCKSCGAAQMEGEENGSHSMSAKVAKKVIGTIGEVGMNAIEEIVMSEVTKAAQKKCKKVTKKILRKTGLKKDPAKEVKKVVSEIIKNVPSKPWIKF